MKIKYQKSQIKDLQKIKELILSVFIEYEAPDYSKEGIIKFIKEVLLNENYLKSKPIYIAKANKKVVGMITSNKKSNKIILLFVDKEYHRKGIATNLFKIIKEKCNEKTIHVNSSPYAISFYHKLGFENTDKQQNLNGFLFTPMKLDCSQNQKK